MLVCSTCHSRRVPCRGAHDDAPFGRCESCGRSGELVSCGKKADQQWSSIGIYRNTAWLKYRRPRKK